MKAPRVEEEFQHGAGKGMQVWWDDNLAEQLEERQRAETGTSAEAEAHREVIAGLEEELRSTEQALAAERQSQRQLRLDLQRQQAEEEEQVRFAEQEQQQCIDHVQDEVDRQRGEVQACSEEVQALLTNLANFGRRAKATQAGLRSENDEYERHAQRTNAAAAQENEELEQSLRARETQLHAEEVVSSQLIQNRLNRRLEEAQAVADARVAALEQERATTKAEVDAAEGPLARRRVELRAREDRVAELDQCHAQTQEKLRGVEAEVQELHREEAEAEQASSRQKATLENHEGRVGMVSDLLKDLEAERDEARAAEGTAEADAAEVRSELAECLSESAAEVRQFEPGRTHTVSSPDQAQLQQLVLRLKAEVHEHGQELEEVEAWNHDMTEVAEAVLMQLRSRLSTVQAHTASPFITTC